MTIAVDCGCKTTPEEKEAIQAHPLPVRTEALGSSRDEKPKDVNGVKTPRRQCGKLLFSGRDVQLGLCFPKAAAPPNVFE